MGTQKRGNEERIVKPISDVKILKFSVVGFVQDSTQGLMGHIPKLRNGEQEAHRYQPAQSGNGQHPSIGPDDSGTVPDLPASGSRTSQPNLEENRDADALALHRSRSVRCDSYPPVLPVCCAGLPAQRLGF